jgi:hypothetical protein
MILRVAIAVFGLILSLGECWASSLEQGLGLTGEMRSASELVGLCTSTDKDRMAYCKGYIEGAIQSWKWQTARASIRPSDQSYCAGRNAARDLAEKVNESLSTDAVEPQKFRKELRTQLGVCAPDENHDEHYCLGYNEEVANSIARLSIMHTHEESESPRETAMSHAAIDAWANAFVSAEFLAFQPCVHKAMTPEQIRKILLEFVRENPEQQINMSASMLLERALFYDYCPGPTERNLKPHLENCITWTQDDGKRGIKNSCNTAVVFEFVAKSATEPALKTERQVIPGNTFNSDPALAAKPWAFMVCPVGYVSAIPFESKNTGAIRASIYSCVKE